MKIKLKYILLFIFSLCIYCSNISAQSDLLSGDLNRVVVLARFNGDPEFDMTKADYNDFLNGTESSLKSYFNSISNGLLNVNSVILPQLSSPSNSFELKYCFFCYESDWAKDFPQCKGSDISSLTDISIGFIIKELVGKIGNTLDNNINIDKDNDGIVDNFVVVLRGTGRGANQGAHTPQNGTISDRFTTTNGAITLNGKIVKNFTIVYERNSLATHCRFLMNQLGFPYLYRPRTLYPRPVGIWDPMDGPELVNPLVYNRWKYSTAKWIEEIPIITEAGTYTLNSSNKATNNAYRINSTNPEEFFILEFRDNSHGYDKSLPESGLLVYRVNSLQTGSINEIPEFYIFRKNGTLTNSGDLTLAAFSNLNERNSFNQSSNPIPFSSTGDSQDISISNIQITGETLSFNVDNLPPTATKDLYSNKMLVFPNPTSGIIHIADNFESAVLSDIMGKQLFRTISPNATINLTNCDNGIYILKLKKGNRTINLKIVKK